MPTRKQRRRRLKERRHEWEEVYLDAEGNEIPPEEVEELLPEMRPARDTGRGEARTRTRSTPARGRAGREIKPASWRRVAKRGAIFAPFMFLFIALTSRDTPVATDVLTTVWLLLIFLPFSYLMDSLVFRMAKKREARAVEARKRL